LIQVSKADTTDMEAVEIAIDFETKGEAFYSKLEKNTDNAQEKQFFALWPPWKGNIGFLWRILMNFSRIRKDGIECRRGIHWMAPEKNDNHFSRQVF
jgi:hypothetical protein